MAGKFGMVKCYFEHGLWSSNQVKDAVSKGMITSGEYKAITGEVFEEAILKKADKIKKTKALRQYIVNTFTEEVFTGNPAAVCVTQEYISDELMNKIAVENKLSNTCFAFKDGSSYNLRLFTPGGEIDLCGHATLAAAYVILNFFEKNKDILEFDTISGKIKVTKNYDVYEIDLPESELISVPVTDQMAEALGIRPKEAFLGRDLLCVFDKEEDIISMRPKKKRLVGLDGLVTHVTAPSESEKYDCVLRSFAPKCKITEDPVSGAAYCLTAPYWFRRLNKNVMVSRQASRRGGTVYCKTIKKGRIILCGKAVLYSEAEIFVD
ncbi:hypothetical protein SDC9_83262 [bioreactor metagenome]|uniref:Isomerase YddE n=1 Tax=bioreactor metagenome TaxID=1076179 RepID=A0A644ZD74_9ZZZZ|nr:PhzF family phenazine biosynthesis isomerase [Candidatus Metalachnospira sp.]